MNPPTVREKPERPPSDRRQNVVAAVTPRIVTLFDYYPWSFGSAFLLRYLSVWATPWWLADRVSAPVSGAFSTAFSSAFDGGIDSPTAPAFSTAFSAAFS